MPGELLLLPEELELLTAELELVALLDTEDEFDIFENQVSAGN